MDAAEDLKLLAGGDPSVQLRLVQIRFHWTERPEGICSVDFHPTLPKLLTAGYDGSVKVWAWNAADAEQQMGDESSTLEQLFSFLSVLTTDDRPTPNVARWSHHHGGLILVAYATGEVAIWKPSSHTSGYFDQSDERALNKEHWNIHKTLKLPADAKDACFTPCNRYVVTGCVNGSIFVHSTETGAVMQQLTSSEGAHDHDCQCVVVDPLGRFVASAGGDRYLKFHAIHTRKHGIEIKTSHNISKTEGRVMYREGNGVLRRASWSPDGAIFAAPCGWMASEDDQYRDCVFFYSRGDLSKHFAYVSTKGNKAVSGVRFADYVLEAYSDPMREARATWGPPEYRYVFAIWTRDTVAVYTSGCSAKICAMSDLHYDIINDVSFTQDRSYLAICSNDGYVTLARFRDSLGKVMRVDAGSHPLSRALALVLPPLVTAAQTLEASITAPPPPSSSSNTTTVVRTVAIKKKEKIKPVATAEPDDASKRPRPDAEAGEERLPEQPAPPQPPAEPSSMTAEELCALL